MSVAEINLKRNQLDGKVDLVKSDLFKSLGDYLGAFDLIVTNPPYVDDRRMESLALNTSMNPHWRSLAVVEVWIWSIRFCVRQNII